MGLTVGAEKGSAAQEQSRRMGRDKQKTQRRRFGDNNEGANWEKAREKEVRKDVPSWRQAGTNPHRQEILQTLVTFQRQEESCRKSHHSNLQ